jgi:hypothetical protein
VQFDCATDTKGLRYESIESNPLGVSPYILGDKKQYATRYLTLEFKNNLDALIDEFSRDSRKAYTHIDVCVCWSAVSPKFEGYVIEEVTEANLDERAYPGVTHLLRRDGDTHVIQIIMLETVVEIIRAGFVPIDYAAPTKVNKKTKK